MFSGDVLPDTRRILLRDHGEKDDPDHFKQKTDALARLLRHAMSRFSRESLYHALQLAINSEEWSQNEADKMAALSQLRDLLAVWNRKDKERGLPSATRQACNCLRTFLKDVENFREVKSLFDEGMYNFLFYEYYDPSLQPDKQRSSNAHPRDRNDDVDSGHFSGAELEEVAPESFRSGESRDPRLGISTMEHMGGNERHKLGVTVKELREVSERWDGLLQENEIDIANFDPESYHELVDFTNYARFERIFRLLPDVFAKCYKCVELSKQWWNLAHIVYSTLPLGRPRPPPTPSSPAPSTPDTDIVLSADEGEDDEEDEDSEEDEEVEEESASADVEDGSKTHRVAQEQGHVTRAEVRHHVKELQAQIEVLGRNLPELEEQLAARTEELRVLGLREQRYNELVDSLEQAEQKLSTLTTRHQDIMQDRQEVLERGTTEYFRCEAELDRLADQLRSGEREVSLLRYQHTLLCQDYELQLSVRPSLILAAENVRTDIMTLSDLLEAQREEKTRLEKELVLVKTNTEQIRDFVRSKVPTTDSLNRTQGSGFDGQTSASHPETSVKHPPQVLLPQVELQGESTDFDFGGRYEEVLVGAHPPLDTSFSPHPRSKSSRCASGSSEGDEGPETKKRERSDSVRKSGEAAGSVLLTARTYVASPKSKHQPPAQGAEKNGKQNTHQLSVPESQSSSESNRARRKSILAEASKKGGQRKKLESEDTFDLPKEKETHGADSESSSYKSQGGGRRASKDKSKEPDSKSRQDRERGDSNPTHQRSKAEKGNPPPDASDKKNRSKGVSGGESTEKNLEARDVKTRRTSLVEKQASSRPLSLDSTQSKLPKPVKQKRQDASGPHSPTEKDRYVDHNNGDKEQHSSNRGGSNRKRSYTEQIARPSEADLTLQADRTPKKGGGAGKRSEKERDKGDEEPSKEPKQSQSRRRSTAERMEPKQSTRKHGGGDDSRSESRDTDGKNLEVQSRRRSNSERAPKDHHSETVLLKPDDLSANGNPGRRRSNSYKVAR